MPGQTQTTPFIDGLYRKLIEAGIGYFFLSATFDLLDPDPDAGDQRMMQTSRATSLVLNWLGSGYSLKCDEPFSESELSWSPVSGQSLDFRYRMIVDATRVEQRFELFRGSPRTDMSPPLSTALHTHRECGKDLIEWKMRSRSCAPVRSAPTKTGAFRPTFFSSGKTRILATKCQSLLGCPALLTSLELNPELLPTLRRPANSGPG